MKREIKFRAGNDSINQMEDMESLLKPIDWEETSYLCHILEKDDRVDYLTLMQFTGLKDKNGVDVYEGDVLVYVDDKNRKQHPFIMEWELDKGQWVKYNPIDRFEVIGNIYLNPELLK